MRSRLVALALSTAAVLVVASSASARRAATAGPCDSGTLASTASYKLALDIGPQEEMYLPSEVKARHIKTGEIMLGGEMSMPDKAPGTKIYHLEVHICSKAGTVVMKLKPSIVVDDMAMNMMGMKLPVAIMVGVGAPMSDYHYGNDVALKPRDKVTVTVTVKGQKAVIGATVPK